MPWSNVRERLAVLAAQPPAADVFGARAHEFRLEPPLTAAELAELETQLGLALPPEYRSFLLEAGRGGAGPAYGLFPVHRVDGRWQWTGDGADLTDLATLGDPFPHREPFNPADGLPPPPARDAFATIEAFNEAEDAYWDHHDEMTYRPEDTVGLLYLCHLGCAYREALVISGPARGQMWADDTAADSGYRPLLDTDGARLGFARWYHRWLDEIH